MKIAFIHAHPDDETLATGALIAWMVTSGHEVSLLTATAGNAAKWCRDRCRTWPEPQPWRPTGKVNWPGR